MCSGHCVPACWDGPLRDAEAIALAVAVGAGMGFDIYQADDDDHAVQHAAAA